jgi:phage gpG-like protein
MPASIDLKFDQSDWLKKIGTLKQKIPSIARKLMKGVLVPMRKDAQKKVTSLFNKGTGTLRRSIRYKANNDWSGELTTYNGKQSGWYASFQEYGGNIQAKEGKYLTFFSNGSWHKVKNVIVPARPFMKPIADSYFGSGGKKANQIMEQTLKSELAKIDKDK